ncbi:MAG: hypothetical protein ACREN6_05705 [Gemmatimonadaceae bacterium]
MNSDRTWAYVVGFGGPALLGIAGWIFHLYVQRANARDDAAAAAAQRASEQDARI